MNVIIPTTLLLSLLTACGARSFQDGAQDAPTPEPVVAPHSDELSMEEEAGLEEGSDAMLEMSDQAPGSFTIDAITAHGPGCKDGTTSVVISPDKQAFTMIFDAFSASLEAGDKRRHASSRCLLDLAFSAPHGWSFGILGVDTRGFVDLEKGMRASERLSVFTRRGFRQLQSKTFKGEVTDDYLLSTDVSTRSALWTSCRGDKKRLILQSTLAIEGRRGKAGIITVDSIDGEVAQNYRIGWRRCS